MTRFLFALALVVFSGVTLSDAAARWQASGSRW